MKHKSDRRFPVNPKDYKLYEAIGEGVSATVYKALCVPLNEIVAIKVLDLEKCNNDLDGIRREVQIMSLINHMNLLCAHCSFTIDCQLWVVMPYMGGGSCLHIMKLAYPEGFDEPVIATILREVLKALVYLHGHGHIHRDIKAGNILIDANGAVKLADFGVSACMFDTGDRQRTRNTFVGTPCWMAPEVLQQLHGYDFKADIWSFGITALELAHGHAPFSKYPPMKVLLMAVQSAPPGLDYERDRRFSKSFKELVAACLVKDPKKRPSSEKLLKHSFFKRARSTEYLVQSILYGLPPLGDRFNTLKEKEMDILQQNQVGSGDKEQLSQQEYIHGVSGWNFNMEDLKAQAALIQTSDHALHPGELDNNHKLKDTNHDADLASQTEKVDLVDTAKMLEDGHEDVTDLDGPFASAFPIRPLQALKTCFDVREDDVNDISPYSKDSRQSNSEYMSPMQQASQLKEFETQECNEENIGRSSSVLQNIKGLNHQKFSSGSLLPDHILSPYKHVAADVDRADMHRKNQSERNPGGPLSYRQMRDPRDLTSATQEESSEGRVVQHKGRFKVTSADANSKVAPLTSYVVSPTGGAPASSTVNLASALPSLQFLLQQNATQKEQLIKLIKCLEQTSGRQDDIFEAGPGDMLQLSQSSSRQRELQAYVVHLQQSVGKLAEEVQRFKFKNAQLESQLRNMVSKEGIRKTKEAHG